MPEVPDHTDGSENSSATHKPAMFDRSDWMAFFAMLISMAALAVSAYEASILREQQAMMQSQQKASVWPYLLSESAYEININEKVVTWSHTVTNKGVGPAIIQNVRLLFEGQQLQDYQEINAFIQQAFPPDHLAALSLFSLDKKVISSNESVQLLQVIADYSSPTISQILMNLGIEVEICYCSIYEDCWTVRNGATLAQTTCPDAVTE